VACVVILAKICYNSVSKGEKHGKSRFSGKKGMGNSASKRIKQKTQFSGKKGVAHSQESCTEAFRSGIEGLGNTAHKEFATIAQWNQSFTGIICARQAVLLQECSVKILINCLGLSARASVWKACIN
jgi:hypothetical protein